MFEKFNVRGSRAVSPRQHGAARPSPYLGRAAVFSRAQPTVPHSRSQATQLGRLGGGGEYQVVDGFGWTNGVRQVAWNS